MYIYDIPIVFTKIIFLYYKLYILKYEFQKVKLKSNFKYSGAECTYLCIKGPNPI